MTDALLHKGSRGNLGRYSEKKRKDDRRVSQREGAGEQKEGCDNRNHRGLVKFDWKSERSSAHKNGCSEKRKGWKHAKSRT